MFSQASVSHSVYRGEGGYLWYQVPSGGFVGGYPCPKTMDQRVVVTHPPSGYWHLVVAIIPTVNKRAVRILRESFLVVYVLTCIFKLLLRTIWNAAWRRRSYNIQFQGSVDSRQTTANSDTPDRGTISALQRPLFTFIVFKLNILPVQVLIEPMKLL